MDFVDLFCGIGTIRMGMEKAGHKCVYSVEWDKWKREMYKIIFGQEPEGRDICDTRAVNIPRADIWCFGAPCQDFSIAGNRKGLEGDRSSLVREVFRLLQETGEENRPKYIIYENVKGMLSSNKGLDFLEILYQMGALGYDYREYQLLNSKNFGVPQNRERVFTIGHFRGRSTRKVFPIIGPDAKVGLPIKRLAHSKNYRRVFQTFDINGSTKAIDTMQGGGRQPCIKVLGNINPSKRGISGTLTTNKGEGPKILVRACLPPSRINKRQNGRRFKEPEEPMFTLTKQDIHGVMISEATKKGYSEAYEGDSINLAVPRSKTRRGRVGKGIANTLDTSCNQGTLINSRIRRLTPRECWRLQGIPDYIIDRVIKAKISDSQMYKGAGDACTVNVIYEIAKKLK